MGPRTGLNVLNKSSFAFYRESNKDRLAVQPVSLSVYKLRFPLVPEQNCTSKLSGLHLFPTENFHPCYETVTQAERKQCGQRASLISVLYYEYYDDYKRCDGVTGQMM